MTKMVRSAGGWDVDTIKYADTLTDGGEGVIQSEGCISMT
jgi:hypothetical protein